MAIVYVSPGLASGADNGLTAADAFRSWASFAAVGCAAGSDVRVNADENSTETVTLTNNILSTGYPNHTGNTTITGYSTDWTTPTLRWRDGSGSPANTNGFTIAIPVTAENIRFQYIGVRNFSRDGLTPTTGQAGVKIFYHCKFNNNGRNGITMYNASTTLSGSQFWFCEASNNAVNGIFGGVANLSHAILKYSAFKNNATYQAYFNSNIQATDCIFVGGQYGVECGSYNAYLKRCVIDGASVNGYGSQSYAEATIEDCAITNCGRAIYSNHAVATYFRIIGLIRYNNTNADSAKYVGILERDITSTVDIYIDRANGDYRQKAESRGRTVADVLIGDLVAFNPTYGIQGTNLLYPNLLQCIPSYGSSDGAVITLSGIGLSGCTSLMFGSTSGTITSSDYAFVSGNAPALAAGRYTITASGTDGIAYISGGFTSVAMDRKITSITKATGDVDGFLVVDIASDEGLFTGATAVEFDGIPARSFELISPYLIKAVVPKLSPDFYRVEIQ